MTVLTSDYRKKLLFCMLIITAFAVNSAFSQTNLIGNLNQPSTHVNTFPGAGNNWVNVDDIIGFKENDTILMIQMQGIGILTPSGDTYGNPQEVFGQPGKHEFLIIQSVTAPDRIEFKNNILNDFKVSGNIQIVRSPYYNAANIEADLSYDKLFCDPWDPVSKKGGVLVMIIGTTLNLKADINVSGLGFKGAPDVAGSGLCREKSGTSSSTYPESFTNAGLKGEGLAIHNDFEVLLAPDNMKGFGPNYTGGGGGNGNHSGGGGGSNRGKGGLGGEEEGTCNDPGLGVFAREGGSGGLSINAKLPDRITLGGGGGGSTSPLGNSGADGGNGGGIVIIVADKIISNGGRILAKGDNGKAPAGAGGSGGGGGGGSIALSLNSPVTNSLNLIASGGNGGAGSIGEGGGGGGGLIFINKSTDIISDLKGGTGANVAEEFLSTGGEQKQTFTAVLNGFLFNSISSSVSGNQKDSVCSDTKPARLNGTTPIGGTSPYTYTWQKSYDDFATAPVDLVTGIGPAFINYEPTAFEAPGKVYFRRIVKDDMGLEDKSLSVEITVQPAITGNTIKSDQTICSASIPAALESAGTLGGGNGLYKFNWEDRISTSDYSAAANLDSASSYTPLSGLTETTWYRRTVRSGRCVDNSAPVMVTVLPAIDNYSILNGDTVICTGKIPHLLRGAVPTGGNGVYTHKWLYSTDNITYNVITGAIDTNFQPPALTATTWYKRLTSSGPCTDAGSAPVKITVLSDITNNNISANQIVCYNTSPSDLTGTETSGGDGTYSYLWEQSVDGGTTWTDASGVNTASGYTPPALTVPTKYRRRVTSGLAGCCVNTSSAITVSLHPPLPAGTIKNSTDTTICGGGDVLLKLDLTGTGTLKIFYNDSFTTRQAPDAVAGRSIVTIRPSSGSAIDTYSYSLVKIQDANGCIAAASGLTGSKKANVYKVPSANAGPDKVVCGPSVILSPVSSVGTGAWSYKFAPADIAASSANSFTIDSALLSAGDITRRFFWEESNWNCRSRDSVDVTFLKRPAGSIVNIADTSICGGNNVLLKLNTTGTGLLRITYLENSVSTQLDNVTAGRSIVTVHPVSGTVHDIYNYSLARITDGNNCFSAICGLSGSKKVDVYKVPSAEAGTDQIVCGPTVTLSPSPSIGTGAWSYKFAPSDIKTYSGSSFTVDTLLLTSGKASRRFFWEEANWTCRSRDSVDITFLRQPDKINAGGYTPLYSFDNVFYFANSQPKSWETGTWSLLSGSGNIHDDRITELLPGLNIFQWKISHKLMESCAITDELKVDVMPIDVPKGISPNDDDKNNTLKIKGLDLANQDVEFTVLNSAGAKVFFTYSYNGEASTWRDWDGTTEGGAMLPDGTYYYLLKMISRNEDAVKKSELLKGFIILKRH
ncbi:MAG TPA: gliding motility-associated C-terminal domain-containing protein [Bacteroidales bacterium]|nr:gliding motility-associated C-terminal domain-containing protein [Bacteroidales bacterium]